MSNASIVKKIIFKIPLETKTPLRIASGLDDGITDILILKTKAGTPFIPATSLGGVLRSKIHDIYGSDVEEIIFGNIDDEDGNQSAINISDVALSGGKIIYRDGIKLDPITNVTAKGAKFDFEALDRGAKGELHLEITLRQRNLNDTRLNNFKSKHANFKTDIFGDISATIADIFTQGLSIGSLTTKGFGKIQSTEPVEFYAFDFSNPEKAFDWLHYLDGQMPAKSDYISKNAILTSGENDLTLIIEFALKSSLIVRNYDVPDDDGENKLTAIQMKSNDDFVIPGSSIKGVLRSRTFNILMCLTNNNENKAENFLNQFMGFAEEKQKTAKKSNLFVNEIYIPSNQEQIAPLKQTRNRIDRFTGGTIDSALFTEEPIWQTDKQASPIKLEFTIKNCTKAQAGLTLLLLKDLWLGNLPIGGGKSIGRGVLQGRKCQIIAPKLLNNEPFEIEETNKFTTKGDKQTLENLVQALVGEING